MSENGYGMSSIAPATEQVCKSLGSLPLLYQGSLLLIPLSHESFLCLSSPIYWQGRHPCAGVKNGPGDEKFSLPLKSLLLLQRGVHFLWPSPHGENSLRAASCLHLPSLGPSLPQESPATTECWAGTGNTAGALFQDFVLPEEVLIIPGDTYELQTPMGVHTLLMFCLQ